MKYTVNLIFLDKFDNFWDISIYYLYSGSKFVLVFVYKWNLK